MPEMIPKEEPSLEAFDMDKVKDENIQLLLDLANLCNRQDRKDVENILLLGMSGGGKSALVNTIIKVIAGQYIPKAPVGKGTAASKTLCLTRYENCGVSKEDIIGGLQTDVVRKLLPKLPTIIDLAGKGNVNDSKMQELLEIIIGGFIQPGTSIESLEELQEKYGPGALRDTIYTKSNPKWKVDKVVFVQGGHDAVPVNLIECLQSVLKITDKDTGVAKYTQDVFVVITKYDLVSEVPQFRNGDGEGTITMEAFQSKEDELAELFNITGALTYNRIRWTSYSDNIGYDNPYVDNIALKFLTRMVTPGVKQPEVKKAVIVPSKILMLSIKKFWKENQGSWHYVLMFIVIAVVALMLGMMLAKPV